MTTLPPRRRRPGLGLTEVLVALFVMALGLISLLTLFPVGAMSIGQGLRDDRCTEAALQADAFLRAYWQSQVLETDNEKTNLVQAFTDSPDGALPALTAATEEGASYPVLVDPIGLNSRTAPGNKLVRGTFPRRGLASTTNLTTAVTTCTLLDDLTFLANGAPEANPTRQGRYNWAAVLQLVRTKAVDATLDAASKPVNPKPWKAIATMKVLCFDSRPPGVAPTDAEWRTSGPIAKGDRQVTVTGVPTTDTGLPPLVRRGGWFLDGSLSGTSRNADFYRITGVTETAAGPGNYTLDFDPPFRRSAVGDVTMYFFAGLAEVYDRPPLAPVR